jgi:hypothetical protein
MIKIAMLGGAPSPPHSADHEFCWDWINAVTSVSYSDRTSQWVYRLTECERRVKFEQQGDKLGKDFALSGYERRMVIEACLRSARFKRGKRKLEWPTTFKRQIQQTH